MKLTFQPNLTQVSELVTTKKPRRRYVAVKIGFCVEIALPSEVSECLVGVCHAVRVFTLGVCDAFFLVRRKQFIG